MPSEQVVEQQIQTPAPMSADNVGIEMQQPVCIILLRTFKNRADPFAQKPVGQMGSETNMRGGEQAACDLCCCGCEESCC
jgi:hypothetical protein